MINSNDRKTHNLFWYRSLLLCGVFLVAISIFFNKPGEIAQGLVKILKSVGGLLTDYMKVGNIGAAFFNAGFMTLLAVALLYFSKTDITGVAIAAVLNLTAFSFMGKNPYNALAPVLGVYLFSKFKGEAFSAPTALFATGVAPFVSYLSFHSGLSVVRGILLGNVIGMLIGFLLSTVGANAKDLHKGYHLYNNGLALGFLSMTTHGVLNLFGLTVSFENTIRPGVDAKTVILVSLGFFALMAGKIFIRKTGYSDFLDLIKETGVSPAEFPFKYDRLTVLFNMGLCGFLGLAYTLVVGANLNGLTLGGIIAMAAFAAFGVTPKNALPIMLGVFLAGFSGVYQVNADAIVMAALYGTCLVPVAGDFGLLPGIVTGFLHLALVTKTGALHGGLLLYNNGLTGGLITAIVVPFFKSIRQSLSSQSLSKQ